ncbi:MAG TPA: hypothetical protein VHL98_02565 [Microvirga sp.]|nr:hypothetical protein [Microvirga sp.]
MPRCAPLLAALLGLAALGAGAGARAQGSPEGPRVQQAQAGAGPTAVIARPAALFLVRSVLLALHQANQTGNYTVLRDISAPGFAQANNAARLADIFAAQRAKGIDLSEVAVRDPDLTPPEVTPQGQLRLAGQVRSSDNQIEFELLFSPVEGRWRLGGIATNVTPLQAETAGARPEPRRPPALRSSTSPLGPLGPSAGRSPEML